MRRFHSMNATKRISATRAAAKFLFTAELDEHAAMQETIEDGGG
jgi:hypothetical protein